MTIGELRSKSHRLKMAIKHHNNHANWAKVQELKELRRQVKVLIRESERVDK